MCWAHLLTNVTYQTRFQLVSDYLHNCIFSGNIIDRENGKTYHTVKTLYKLPSRLLSVSKHHGLFMQRIVL